MVAQKPTMNRSSSCPSAGTTGREALFFGDFEQSLTMQLRAMDAEGSPYRAPSSVGVWEYTCVWWHDRTARVTDCEMCVCQEVPLSPHFESGGRFHKCLLSHSDTTFSNSFRSLAKWSSLTFSFTSLVLWRGSRGVTVLWTLKPNRYVTFI